MDEYNYVADNGDGRWIVVINGGEPKYYNSQGEAENAFNAAKGSGSPGGGNKSAWSDDLKRLWEALVTSNQQDFDEKKRQFDAQLALEARRLGLDEAKFREIQRQFDIQLAEDRYKFQYSQYGDMAKYVLGLSAGYTGPQDMFKYLKATGGGQDVFDIMSGGKAVPEMGAGEYVQPGTIADLMARLGIKFPGAPPVHPLPEPYPPGGGAPAVSDDTYLDYIWSKRPDLKAFFESNGWDVSTPEGQRKAVRHWMTNVDPAHKGKTPEQVAKELGYKPSTAQPPGAVGDGGLTDDALLQSIYDRRPDLQANHKSSQSGLSPIDYMKKWWRYASGNDPGAPSGNTDVRVGESIMDYAKRTGVTTTGAGSPAQPLATQTAQGGPNMPYQTRFDPRFAAGQRPASGSILPPAAGQQVSIGAPGRTTGYGGYPGVSHTGGLGGYNLPGQQYSPTDVDRAYNDAYAKAMQADRGYSTEMFRMAPQGWQPGAPTGYQPMDKQRLLPGYSPTAQALMGGARIGAPTPITGYGGYPDNSHVGGLGGYNIPQNPDDIGPPPKGVDPYIWRGLSPEARALYRRQGYLVPYAHQTDIGKWESMSPEQQKAYLAASEQGLGRGGYMSASEYLRQLNAARPKGNAPRQVNYSWSNFRGGY